MEDQVCAKQHHHRQQKKPGIRSKFAWCDLLASAIISTCPRETRRNALGLWFYWHSRFAGTHLKPPVCGHFGTAWGRPRATGLSLACSLCARVQAPPSGDDHCLLQVFDASGTNVALRRPCTASSGYGDSSGNPSNAVDGVASARPHPAEFHSSPIKLWRWRLVGGDLGHACDVRRVVFNRGDFCEHRIIWGRAVSAEPLARTQCSRRARLTARRARRRRRLSSERPRWQSPSSWCRRAARCRAPVTRATYGSGDVAADVTGLCAGVRWRAAWCCRSRTWRSAATRPGVVKELRVSYTDGGSVSGGGGSAGSGVSCGRVSRAPRQHRHFFLGRRGAGEHELVREARVPGERALAACPWKEFKNADGQTYYYNAESKASVWGRAARAEGAQGEARVGSARAHGGDRRWRRACDEYQQ